MTASHLKTGIEATAETSWISDAPQTVDNAQHNVGIIYQPLLQTCRESADPLSFVSDVDLLIMCSGIWKCLPYLCSKGGISLYVSLQPEEKEMEGTWETLHLLRAAVANCMEQSRSSVACNPKVHCRVCWSPLPGPSLSQVMSSLKKFSTYLKENKTCPLQRSIGQFPFQEITYFFLRIIRN
jgi:hypothetical protein